MRRIVMSLCLAIVCATPIGVRDVAAADPLETRVTISFAEAPAPEVLRFLCEMAGCAWTFDAERGLRVTAKR
jgi:hypothetical protein